jgi:fido (protein-threonine AMPylation protein)
VSILNYNRRIATEIRIVIWHPFAYGLELGQRVLRDNLARHCEKDDVDKAYTEKSEIKTLVRG